MTKLAGVVVDEVGNPVSGARVSIRDVSQRGCSIIYNCWVGATDELGRFEADRLAPGDYDVLASWDRAFSNRHEALLQQVRAGDTDIRIILAAGGTITGRVVLDGAPLTRFGVAFSEPNAIRMDPEEIRDSDGRFALPHVALGTWWVRIWAPGTRHKVETVTIDQSGPVDLGDILMQRGQRVTGRARTIDGAPVHDARIQIGMWGAGVPTDRSQLGGWFEGHFESRTDQRGEFVFDGIDAHVISTRPTYIWATHETSASLISELPETDTTIDLVLREAGGIEGVVQGLDDRHTSVRATHRDEPTSRMVHADDEGRFAFAGLPVGDYELSLYGVACEALQVTVCANEVVTVTIVPHPTVDLTIRLPSGRSHDLVIEPEVGGIRGISRHGTEDRCTMHFVPPGTYRMSLDGATWREITIQPTPASQTIDLRDA